MKLAEAYVEVTLKAEQAKAGYDALDAKGTQVLGKLSKPTEVGVTGSKAKGELDAVETKAGQTSKAVGKRTDVDVKTDKAKAELSDLEQRGQDTAKKLAQYFGAAAFGAALAKSTKAASDLNEAVNVTGLVFKESRGEIERFVKSSAELVGMSQTVARTTTANFGGFLKNLGMADQEAAKTSITLTKLAADLGSAFNKDPAEAALALQSALRGEQEPIRAFNVSLNEAALKIEAVRLGLDASGPSLSANVRAQAALSLIMQQTSAVQGDFANTSDQAANATRIAQAKAEDAAASLGQSFLPIYKEAVKVVSFLAEGFGKLPQPAQLAIVALAGIIALSGPIKDTIGLVKSLQTSLAAASFSPMTAGLLALGVAAGLVVGALTAHAAAQKAAKAQTDELVSSTLDATLALKDKLTADANEVEALNAITDATRKVSLANIEKRLTDKNQVDDLARLGLQFKDLTGLYADQATAEKTLIELRRKAIETGEVKIEYPRDALESVEEAAQKQRELVDAYIQTGKVAPSVIKGNDDLIHTFEDLAKTSDASKKQLLDLAAAGNINAERWALSSGALSQLDAVTQDKIKTDVAAADAAGKVATATTGVGKAAAESTDDLDKMTKKLKPMKTAEEEAADAAKDLQNAIDGIFGNALSFDAALSDYNEKLGGLGKALKENGKTLDVGTEKGRANRAVVRESTQAAIDYATALQASGASNEEVTGVLTNYTQALYDQLRGLGLSEEETRAYIAQLKLTPADITTTIKLAEQETAKRQAQELLESYNKMPDSIKTQIQALIDKGSVEDAKRALAWFETTHTISYNVDVATGARDELLRIGKPHAAGGGVRAGLPVPVGERGKELFVPETDGAIVNAEALRTIEQGGGGRIDASVTINGNVYGVDDLNAYMEERDRKLQRALLAGRR